MKSYRAITALILAIFFYAIPVCGHERVLANNQDDAIQRQMLGEENNEEREQREREAEKDALILESAPQQLKDLISKMKKYKESGCKKHLKQFKPIITLVGVPGTGKTSLAELLAKEVNSDAVVNVDCTKLGNQYQNSAENNLRSYIAQARALDPELVFVVMDEIQALTDDTNPSRDATGRAFAKMVDEAEKDGNVIFIITANKTEQLPDMLLSRLAGQRFEIKAPELQNKERVFNYYLKNRVKDGVVAPEQIALMANKCEKCSYRDIESISIVLNRDLEGKASADNKVLEQKITDHIKTVKKEEKSGKGWKEIFTDKERWVQAGLSLGVMLLGGALNDRLHGHHQGGNSGGSAGQNS